MFACQMTVAASENHPIRVICRSPVVPIVPAMSFALFLYSAKTHLRQSGYSYSSCGQA